MINAYFFKKKAAVMFGCLLAQFTASMAFASSENPAVFKWFAPFDSTPFDSPYDASALGVSNYCKDQMNPERFQPPATSCVASAPNVVIGRVSNVLVTVQIDKDGASEMASAFGQWLCAPETQWEERWEDPIAQTGYHVVCLDVAVPPPPPIVNVAVTAIDKSFIPEGSLVKSKKVLTRNKVTVLATNQAKAPLSGINLEIQSNRSADILTQPSELTDQNGITTALVETRNQAEGSVITPSAPTIKLNNADSGTIQWLPARYKNSFLVTCYRIANENDHLASPLVSKVSGLPVDMKLHQTFIKDVKMQGSGQASDGTILHYDGDDRYSIQSCARTATGACAVDGTTIAVDPQVIPLRGTASIDKVGTRKAQDTGGRIIGNHIDIYYGSRSAECIAAGRRTLNVDFIAY